MARRASKRELKRMEQEGFRGRSNTYRYIRLNIERFLELGVGTNDGPSWEWFAAMLGRENQKNKQGGPISRDSARKMFERASKDARARKHEVPAAIQQHKRQPSSLPATWRPTPAAPPPSSLAVVQKANGPAPAPNTQEPTTEELITGFRRVLLERSGR